MEPTPNRPATEATKRPSTAFLVVCGLVVAFAIGLRVKEAIELRHPLMAEATLRGRTFAIEVADTPAKRELGLGERDSLPADQGMYFPFGASQRWVFWMKGMRFPIDIIWIQDGKIVDIEGSVPVPKGLPLETYAPVGPADAVLELNAGVAQEIGLEPGDEVILRAPENKG